MHHCKGYYHMFTFCIIFCIHPSLCQNTSGRSSHLIRKRHHSNEHTANDFSHRKMWQTSDLLAVQRKRRPWCHPHRRDSGGEEGGRPTLGWLCASGPADRWSAPWGLQSSPAASIYGWECTLGYVCSNPVHSIKTQNNHFPAIFSEFSAQETHYILLWSLTILTWGVMPHQKLE